MRRPIVAGNWKMNKTPAEAAELTHALLQEIAKVYQVERVLCPPFVSLAVVGQALEGTDVSLGAQNMHWEKSGAFTGEVSAPMLKGLCEYVIIGHSERRQYFGETDEIVHKKIHAALEHSLTPIVCVGETLAQHDAGEAGAVVIRQVKAAYSGLPDGEARKLIIAYEPIWAIGTGRAATADYANHIIKDFIRATTIELYSKKFAEELLVQYGGSVTGANAEELMRQPDIDGALVGGASLKPVEFGAIVRAAARRAGG